MCGICGVYHPLEEEVDRTTLQRMTDTMFHRGPDDEGLLIEGPVGLGARRLAIIDLSSAGHQPMSNEDGSKWIVHNGEIYNYVELRRDLQGRGHRFRSGTDTEVILHLYEEQGVQCLESLRGMFAFAIWDRSTRTLFAARDRLGIKPLYYHWDGSCFRFGSEIKAILADPRVRLEANPAAIAQYLRYMYVPGEATFYAGIRRLLPGHFLVVTPRRMAVEKYWDVQFGGDEQSEAHYIERFREILHEVVALHLRSDVPVGSHLSGGLDSSLLVGVASRSLGRPLKTFSARFLEGGQYDEGPYIRLVTDRFHTEHYEIVPTAASFAEILPKLMWLLDEPTMGPSVVPQYQVCELARRHVKVVLGGQGGDELFGGYYRYLLPALLDHARRLFRGGGLGTTAGVIGGLWRQVRTPEMRRFLEKVSRRRRTLALLNRDFRGQMRIGPAGDEGGRDGSGQSATDRYLGWDLRNYLPGLLHVEDRTSMAASIESRVPFLDHRLVEFAATIPPHVKLRRLVLKHVEREAARGILPDAIIERSDKIGFATPLRDWLKGALKEPMADLLLAPTTQRRGIFDVARLERALRHHGEGRGDWSLPLWMAINIELWYRQCIDR